MSDAILCVDDDASILEGFRRGLSRDFTLKTALGPEEGLMVFETQGPFSVVVSDLQMPGLNGIQFLSCIRDMAPDTVRILLTGNADLQTAIDGINQGQLFRFLTKPCPAEQLATALQAGLAQYRLVTAERELLDHTLSGSLKVLCEILSLVNPEAFGRSARIARYAEAIAVRLKVTELWAVKTAAMLSQIGCVILPEALLKKVYRGRGLTPEESQLYSQHPFLAADLIDKIPRMKLVADIIRNQDKYFDGYGVSGDHREGGQIPVETRILKVALDFDALESTGKTKTEAFEELKKRKGWYDPAVVEALKVAFAKEIKYEIKAVVVEEMAHGMILGEGIMSSTDILLASRGESVNQPMILRMQNFKKTMGVREPFTVLVPMSVGDLPVESSGQGTDAPPPRQQAA
jgi:response regulator RpfG family c-di-GMP phosphodiesterase